MDNQDLLTQEELGISLELANLISGAASSTLGMLVDPGIEIGQPNIQEFDNLETLMAHGLPPQSVISVLHFIQGLESPVAFILDMNAAVNLADIMMGGSVGAPNTDISDIQLSAIGEALSQMMGVAANNLSQFLSKQVDISAPQVSVFSPQTMMELLPEIAMGSLVTVKYPVSGSTLLPNCELIQIVPTAFVRQQVDMVRTSVAASPESMSLQRAESERVVFDTGEPTMAGIAAGRTAVASASMEEGGSGGFSGGGFSSPPGVNVRQTANPVTVQPVEFTSFDNHISASGGINKNLELVMDVCLNLTVELGRTELPIKDVLELTRGSVIELNRIAGESVDLFANGKMIAKGEVVVIEDNFGLRITSIVSPAERLRGL